MEKEEIIQELKEIKKLLQIIVSNQELQVDKTIYLKVDGSELGKIFFKNDVNKMPVFMNLTNHNNLPKN